MAGLLIVDDEVESREEIRLVVQESQYSYLSIFEAGSAERGLVLLKQNQPNIVILDLSLPDMDGLQFGKKVLELYPNVSIIVLTHLKMFEMVQAAINAGFSGYLLKPLSKMDLFSTFDRLLIPDLIKEANYLRKAVSSSKTIEIDLGNPIQSALNYIHSNFHEPITLNEVADRVYLSASHFSRLFKAEMGVTFIEYLTKYRVEQSKRLLKMTSLPIEVIANNTGFANASYFATTFKRIEGMTPSEYRSIFSNLLHNNDPEEKFTF
ncbi:response regulator transcription factor [Thermoflavimicrobium dichotomicum]|uniref:Response regulator receiver domain-containing protein n=1 Tax=Thermoflavimicrobium dichotomicum TaxID=46223 RepID=A0A1I3UG35_9BACL|nr:helix-turn-helix domain-containing protein [Thermoflavimicrobium dichotomicum]SFJ81892.1 Response regulator receiver domain-containing protein [Thermoflavimicrobium dichotomicum]